MMRWRAAARPRFDKLDFREDREGGSDRALAVKEALELKSAYFATAGLSTAQIAGLASVRAFRPSA